MHFEAVHFEHEAHDVFADVVDVAADGAEDHDAQLLGLVGLGGQERLQDVADLAQHLAAHDELGQEVGAFLVAGADHLHGLTGEVEDLVGVFPLGQQLVHDLESFLLLHVGHGFDEFVHLLLLLVACAGGRRSACDMDTILRVRREPPP